jgi:hypothetical protein
MRDPGNHRRDIRWSVAIAVLAVVATLLAIWLLS